MSDTNQIPEHTDFHAPWSDELAQWYAQKHGEHSSNYKTIEMAELNPRDTLLDIGCGSGAAVREAASYVTQGHAVGLDLSPGMIRIAQEKTPPDMSKRATFMIGQATQLHIEDDSKTVVTAINSLHHWPDPMAGLEEVRRVLCPGGRLLICEDVLTAEEQSTRNTFDQAKVASLLRQAGFQQLRSRTFKNPDGELFIIQCKAP